MNDPLLLITPGEPAGIGPDLIVQLAHQHYLHNCIVVADPSLLKQRADQLNLPLTLNYIDPIHPRPESHALNIIPISLKAPCTFGELNAINAGYVLETLRFAASACLAGKYAGLITGPVHKGIINDAGIAFQGHTQFLAEMANTPDVVMMLMSQSLRVALLTTHIPLSQVPAMVTQPRLEITLRILESESAQKLGISNPRILICGLNPHAGEGGHLGREEIEVISPVIRKLTQEGFNLTGPLPADTIFTPKYLQKADIILAMYHDQGLPVIKYAAFGQVVNITLGLPFIRTSVDHGTALDLAGTGQADTGSFQAAIEVATQLGLQKLRASSKSR